MILQASPQLSDRMLAENLACDSRVSPMRAREFLTDWGSAGMPVRRLRGGFDKWVKDNVKQPPNGRPQFADRDLNGLNLGASFVHDCRQLLDFTGLLTHLLASKENAELLDDCINQYPVLSGEAPLSLPAALYGTDEYTKWMDELADHAARVKWVDVILRMLDRDPCPKPVWEPTWVTVLTRPPTDAQLEVQLAQVGVEPKPGYYVELRYRSHEICDPLMAAAAPTVLDGGSEYWHTPVPPDVLTYCGGPDDLGPIGYSVDLRDDPLDGAEPWPELITREMPCLWWKAWNHAGRKVVRVKPDVWRKACGFSVVALDLQTLESRRIRHRRALAMKACPTP